MREIEIEIKIEVRLNNTEDPEKVVQSVRNVANCQNPVILESELGRLMVFQGSCEEFLHPLRRLLREQRILSAARRILKEGLRDNIFHFYLNKQAAYVNQVSFCEEEGESPLGPITFTIKTQDAEGLLDWLTIRRRKGRSAKP